MWPSAHQNSYTTPVINVRHWDHHLSLPLWHKITWSIEGPNDRERSHAPNMVKWTNPTSKASFGADSEAGEGKSGVSLKVLGFKVVLLSKYQRLPVGVFSGICWVDDVVLSGNRCQRQRYKLVIGDSAWQRRACVPTGLSSPRDVSSSPLVVTVASGRVCSWDVQN